MRVVSLLENTAAMPGIGVEHGLSLYVEWRGVKLLFDMGQSGLFAQNAEALGVDLSAVDVAVLSHGHYDHGGGLSTFLALNDHAPVYVHADAFLPHYNGTEKYIGLDKTLQNEKRIIFVDDILKIDDELSLYSCNNNIRNHYLDSFGLNMKCNGEFLPDDFKHEQYLLINENGKRVLISGCSHKGVMDIAEWFEPDALVGGFHYSKLPLDEKLKEYALTLASHKTSYYTCHCTGTEQYEFMKKYMPQLSYLSCGQSIVL
jgi:7,8-dihydropterin-6-yl-methyl-4-(beta-D-ribofuranosyl)aminobenzene 5'-phosphate synthase